MLLAGFDLETDGKAGEENLGITCAAIYEYDTKAKGGATYLFHGAEMDNGEYAPKMSEEDLKRLIIALEKYENLVAWNGVSFDLYVIYEAVEDPDFKKRVQNLGKNLIDPGWGMLCDRGYMISLAAAAEGLGVQGKMEDMDGLKAIDMWEEGREAQEIVLKYVEQDAIATINVLVAALDIHGIPWTSKSGKSQFWSFNGINMRGEKALEMPRPNTAWMDDPRDPYEESAWMEL